MRPAQRAIFCLGQLPARVGTLVVQAGEAALERHRKASDHGIVRPAILQLVQHRLVAEPGIPANAGLRRGWWNRHKSLPCPAVCGAGCSPYPIHAVNHSAGPPLLQRSSKAQPRLRIAYGVAIASRWKAIGRYICARQVEGTSCPRRKCPCEKSKWDGRKSARLLSSEHPELRLNRSEERRVGKECRS